MSTSASKQRYVEVDDEVASFWREAIRCRLCTTMPPYRKFPADKRGCARYRLMILGEAPGRVSLDNGRPFSNKRNLTVRRAFAIAIAPRRLEPEQLFYFSDTVKCWPASESGANRSPSARETATCIGIHLTRELTIIRPRVILAFGAKAASAVLKRPVKLSEVHGVAVDSPDGIRVIPLMHPSTINIAGMRRVGIRSLEEYETRLAAIFRREISSVMDGREWPSASDG